MNLELSRKLETLRADFAEQSGNPFEYFYCPLLFRDEPAELCRAHIVNKAFPQADPAWTVQRRDIDNFFGSAFEAQFVLLEERDKHDIVDVLSDGPLSRKLRPVVTLDGKRIDFYHPGENIPSAHTAVELVRDGVATAKLALKLTPEEVLAAVDGKWVVEISQNVQLAALASLIKAAHLGMFHMLGYRYGLSGAGHFVGFGILGDFYLRNRSLSPAKVRSNALTHFREYSNLVRPAARIPDDLRGTVSDQRLYLCMSGDEPWAFLVFIRTGTDAHAVILPVLESADGAARFVRFLQQSSTRIEAKLARYTGDSWEVSTKSRFIDWPEGRFSDHPSSATL